MASDRSELMRKVKAMRSLGFNWRECGQALGRHPVTLRQAYVEDCPSQPKEPARPGRRCSACGKPFAATRYMFRCNQCKESAARYGVLESPR